MTEFDRRKVLMASGTAVTIGLAGCINGDGDDDGNGNGNGNGNGDASPEDEIDSYLSDNDAKLYEGTDSIVDETGSDSTTIMVGGGDGLAFDPPAVRISTGTEVTWEWTGDGGNHNVASQSSPDDNSFENPDGTVSEEGHEYSKTFEAAGAYTYQCDPHSAQGMRGALLVEE